jgi:hypothetical protein
MYGMKMCMALLLLAWGYLSPIYFIIKGYSKGEGIIEIGVCILFLSIPPLVIGRKWRKKLYDQSVKDYFEEREQAYKDPKFIDLEMDALDSKINYTLNFLRYKPEDREEAMPMLKDHLNKFLEYGTFLLSNKDNIITVHGESNFKGLLEEYFDWRSRFCTVFEQWGLDIPEVIRLETKSLS